MRQIAVLTDQEIEILKRGRADPNIITNYFFRPTGAKSGYSFDYNFDPEGAWQKAFVMMSQKTGIVSGGIGTGKTTCIAMGACWLALIVHPDFKFMNVAPTTLQAQWMYEYILKQAVGTPFERLIYASPAKPYPKIEIRFKVLGQLVSSSMLFMSIDKNARNIFTFEGDWINVDEAGMIDNLQEVLVSIGTRLRGSYRNRERMGRLTLTSNPWDNPYFWYMFDLAQGAPEENLSIVVSTIHNHNISESQLKSILQRIPKTEWQKFIHGGRPEGSNAYFSQDSIYGCEDEDMGDFIQTCTTEKTAGYEMHRFSNIGVNSYKTPKEKEALYMIFGDPGTDSCPNRNAPVLMVFKVNDFPDSRAELMALWWGDGARSIAPFVHKLAELIVYYDPFFVGIDSTATQKNTSETINALFKQRDDEGLATVFGSKYKLPKGAKITGLDFSGSKKSSYLIALQMLLEAHLFRWPKLVAGIRGQLSNYDPSKDKSGAGKIPQDLVATLSMAAFVIRRYFYVDPEKSAKSSEENVYGNLHDVNANRVRYERAERERRDRTIPGEVSEDEYFDEIDHEMLRAPVEIAR